MHLETVGSVLCDSWQLRDPHWIDVRDRGALHELIRANGVQAGVPRMNLAALHCHLGSCFVALHEAFDKVGLQYGPGYRTLEQVWGGGHTTRQSAPRALFTPGQARSQSRT